MAQEIIVIKISRSYRKGMTPDELYLATSRSWKLSMERCKHVRTVLCVAENEVKEVYTVEEWIQSSDEGRKEFVGSVAQNRSAQHGSVKMQATSLPNTGNRFATFLSRRPLRLLQQVHLRLPHR